MNNPLVDLSPLAQPITKLVEVVAQGIGTLYKPVGTVLQAKADAKAKIITAEADVEVVQLQRRAAQRLVYVETARQKNLESIIQKAQAALPDRVREDPVPKDWITYFFTAAQDVSDEDMQLIWGRILAGEVAEPGSISRRTLEFLKTMSKDEAEMFTVLMSVSFTDQNGWRFIVEDGATINTIRTAYGGLDFMRHLTDIGLLGVNSVFMPASKTSGVWFSYGTEHYRFVASPPQKTAHYGWPLPDPHLSIRLFSSIGQELSGVAQHKVLDDFVTHLSRSLEDKIKVNIEKDIGEQTAPPLSPSV
jgi:hypothetical protein